MNDTIETVHLFPRIDASLIDLMRNMDESDWNRETQFKDWKVKDICAHLLDTAIRRLSGQRDGYSPPGGKVSVNSYPELIDRITFLADRWATAFSAVSPAVLTELMEIMQNELSSFLRTVDPMAPSRVAVAWAGESTSLNWFDIAREYTERWHHQMQIREALREPPLYDRDLYHPVLETFFRALPHHYRSLPRSDHYLLKIDVTGSAGGSWFLEWMGGHAVPVEDDQREPDTVIGMDQAVAWKIFTRFNRELFDPSIGIAGDQGLGRHLLEMNCLMIAQG